MGQAFVQSSLAGHSVGQRSSSFTAWRGFSSRKVTVASRNNIRVSAPTCSEKAPGESKECVPLGAGFAVMMTLFAKALELTLKGLYSTAEKWQADERNPEYKYAEYKYAEYPGGEDGALPKMTDGLPRREIFSAESIGDLSRRTYEYSVAQMPFIARLNDGPPDKNGMWKGLPGGDVFRSVFEANEVLKEPVNLVNDQGDPWKTDSAFARQFITGCSPIFIERVTPDTIDRIPQEFHKKDQLSPDGLNIHDLVNQNRLFIADYELLGKPGVAEALDDKTGAYIRRVHVKGHREMIKYFYAPFVVLYKDDDGELQVFGIMLTRNRPTGQNFIYSQRSCENKKTTYLFAKMHVACADNQYHQFIGHLGLGHLTWEPFSIAYNNIFRLRHEKHEKHHVVGKLLSQHFKNAIAINWLAREVLVASREEVVPLTDATFAVGGTGAVNLFKHAYSSWSFDKSSLPEMLKSRGFSPDGTEDELKGYWYREDAMLIWRAIEKYVESIIEAAYESDAHVQDDRILKEWCEELCKRANVRGFPASFGTRKQLADAVTTIIFHVSAQHSALNFSQLRYLSYVPNRPNCLFRAMPAEDEQEDMPIDDIMGIWDLGGASQPLSFMQFQVQFAYLLTTPSRKADTLMELNAMEKEYPAAHKQFKKDLKSAHQKIKERNEVLKNRRPAREPYEFLDPCIISQSIER